MRSRLAGREVARAVPAILTRLCPSSRCSLFFLYLLGRVARCFLAAACCLAARRARAQLPPPARGKWPCRQSIPCNILPQRYHSLQHSTHTVACTPPKEAEICKSTFSTRRVRHKAQPSAEDSGRCSGAAARWLITPKRPGATCGAGEEYQEKYGPHGLTKKKGVLHPEQTHRRYDHRR